MGKISLSFQKKDTWLLIVQALTLIIVSWSVWMQQPHITYWKDRCDALEKQHSNKIAEIQTQLSIFVNRIDMLEKENTALKEENLALTKKVEDVKNSAIAANDQKLIDTMSSIKQSVDKISEGLQNQTAKITEAKKDLSKTNYLLFNGERIRIDKQPLIIGN